MNAKVWGRLDWFWHLPAIGFEIGANLSGEDCARWFKFELRLLFLWADLRIEGQDPHDGEGRDNDD